MPAELSREQKIANAERLAEQGKLADAATKLRELLVIDPGDVEVLFMLASLTAANGDLAEAVNLLDAIPADHPEAGIPALGQSAQWCMELKRYDEAERRYQEVLRYFPDAAPARRQLAFLLNCQGRRHEAAVHIRALCKLGDVRQDELHSLIVLGHAMYDDPNESPDVTDQRARYHPIGPSGKARKLFTDGMFVEAAEAIHDAVEQGTAAPSVVALYGRAVVEAQDDQRFQWWLAKTDQQTQQHADYWAAVGTYLISQRRFDEATRALLEAVNRDPTDLNSLGRLVQTFSTLGDEETSERWFERWDAINETVKANNRVTESDRPDPDRIAELADLLKALDRTLESLLWKSLESHYRGTLEATLPTLNADRQRLVQSGQGFPSLSERLCNVDLKKFPIPELETTPDTAPIRSLPTPQRLLAARFINIAESAGLDHAYQVAAAPQRNGFAIYQTYGGAVVVLDYDLDGKSDLYFAQGGSDPPAYRGQLSNQLLRNATSTTSAPADGARLTDVTEFSTAGDNRYSMGATAGDWNQDGFPDLVVANIGEDTLLINNGDGTFTRQPIVAPDDEMRVPTSIAMADLNGDRCPEIFELAYVDDPKMIFLPKRNERGEVLKAMSPLQYDPGHDRICENDQQGGMTIRRFTTETKDLRTGLGLVVTDILEDQPGNEVFVGNDLFPDHLWVRDQESGDWSDVAPAVGCAFGIRGSKTASMGIAAGDYDNSGTVDLHITNYQDRNASLFLNLGQSFLERNVQYGLAADSQAVLGFGSQATDYDNDGDRDLVATNGHIEQSLSITAPFEQPAQLFANLGGRFQLATVEDPSGYWDAGHLGRGLARLDFNNDGKEDFAITHLGERSALLLNQTETTNHWIQLRLVGVDSERDAIGAKVQIEYDGREATDWVIAGDGYFCRNQAMISFGLGTASEVDAITVRWPSGSVQRMENVAGNQKWLIIENEAEPFRY